jgi:hypothetical protein
VHGLEDAVKACTQPMFDEEVGEGVMCFYQLLSQVLLSPTKNCTKCM